MSKLRSRFLPHLSSTFFGLGLALVFVLGGALSVRSAAPGPRDGAGAIEAFVLEVDRDGLEDIAMGGFDMLQIEPLSGDRFRVAVALTEERWQDLALLGHRAQLWFDDRGRTFTQGVSAHQKRIAQDGGGVFREYDGPGGIEEEIRKLAADHPGHVELIELGRSNQDRPILALRVTADAADTVIGDRPMVLFNSLQHAREWIAIETNRRLAEHFITEYGMDDTVTDLVDNKEIWFIVCANPDGYQITHTPGGDFRLWRRTVVDTNENGEIEGGDGVDPNRNFDSRWNYDVDGSNSNPRSDTYRGPSPASEPSVKVLQDLLLEQPFEIMLNYHSAAELILWPEGWQDETRTADDAIYGALAGDRNRPAVPGFLPILSAGLYITNGETCDFAHSVAGVLCYTPELSVNRSGGSGFEFPDDEAQIEAEFQLNLPFALDIAKSAGNLNAPSSHLGNSVESMYVSAFETSYGDPQPVEATVQRRLGDVEAVWLINGGAEQRAPAVEWDGGERFGDTGDVYYRRVRAEVSGAEPGDLVTVWFEAGGERTEPFDYRLELDSENPVLILAAEDYTGIAPDYEKVDGPTYLDIYTRALTQAEYGFDVYDIDAHDRLSPSHMGVLSHYDAVIWYTGDDIIPRDAGMEPGTTTRETLRTMIAVRAFLNEGGKLLWTGKYAGLPYQQGQEFDPVDDAACDPNSGDDGCEDLANDFNQYYMGAEGYEDLDDLTDARFVGRGIFEGLDLALDNGSGENHAAAWGRTEERMARDDYPLFATDSGGYYGGLGSKPRTGEHFLYSGESFYSYQRVGRTIDLSDVQSNAELRFWANRDIRQPFDALFVEIHTVGEDNWTTLEGLGITTQQDGASCWSSVWFSFFPQLQHYMSPGGGQRECLPTGTTGEWHAVTGASNGWEEWIVDLSDYAGQEVEVFISYVSSRVAFPGVFLDDASIHADGSLLHETSFETPDLGGWQLSSMPVTANETEQEMIDFFSATFEDLPPIEHAAVVSEDSILLGFGFEAIVDELGRVTFMEKALEYLLGGMEPPTPQDPTIYLPMLKRE